ncbi:MAG: hypothetical protein ACREV2_07580, partial [Burkholderiales bacterium]
MNRRNSLKGFIGGIVRLSFAALSEGDQYGRNSRGDLLAHSGFLRTLRRLFLAFTAIIFVTGAGCAWAADGFGPEQPCPLTAEQAKKAATAFLAMRDVYRHPRCINCHGVYGDLHENPNTRHPKPGGHIPLIPVGHGTAPEDQCISCHDRGGAGKKIYLNPSTGQYEIVPADRKWELPPEHLFFSDRTDVQVCRRFKGVDNTGVGLLKHLKEDRPIMLAFEGKKGQSNKPADPPRSSANKVIAHGDFIKLAEQWLTAVYGTNSPAAWQKPFPGEEASDCGC